MIFCPKYTIICKDGLERTDLYEKCCKNIKEFHFDLIPLEKDLFSLEMNHCFRKMYINSDFSTTKFVKHSIQRLELVYGKIRKEAVFSIGRMANIIHKHLEDEQLDFPTKKDGNIDCLILIDRKVDLITPLCT